VTALVPWLLVGAVLLLLGAHVAIVVGVAQRRAFLRAVLVFFVVPLAPYWAWREGMRRRLIAWTLGLGLYALGVAIA
jgi:hypothetical protein